MPDHLFLRRIRSNRFLLCSLLQTCLLLASSRHFIHCDIPQLPSVHSIRTSVPVIGIVGGIGSGKSTVIRHVRRFRLLMIDADQLAHEQMQQAEVLDRIKENFGSSVLTAGGEVDRQKLAERVFGSSPAHLNARRTLEQILHPVIRQEVVRIVNEASQDVDAVILDAALLLEAGWADDCDALIFVDTPFAIRQARVRQNRGWSEDELARREAVQLPVELKRTRAGFVVDNSGSLDESARQMEHHLESIIHPVK